MALHRYFPLGHGAAMETCFQNRGTKSTEPSKAATQECEVRALLRGIGISLALPSDEGAVSGAAAGDRIGNQRHVGRLRYRGGPIVRRHSPLSITLDTSAGSTCTLCAHFLLWRQPD